LEMNVFGVHPADTLDRYMCIWDGYWRRLSPLALEKLVIIAYNFCGSSGMFIPQTFYKF
jgi:hypothetical protein